MIVAVIALIVALGGTAGAATLLITSSAQIKDGAIRLQDLAPSARQALKGQPGQQGPAGEPGSALAFAFVNADGSLDPTRSKNVLAAKLVQTPPVSPAVGYYCIDLAPGIQPKSIVATVDTSGAVRSVVASLTSDVFGLCSGFDAVVTTSVSRAFPDSPGVPTDRFNVVFN